MIHIQSDVVKASLHNARHEFRTWVFEKREEKKRKKERKKERGKKENKQTNKQTN